MNAVRWFHVYLASTLTLVGLVCAVLLGVGRLPVRRRWRRARADAERNRLWHKYGKVDA